MKFNKLKILSIAVCCAVTSLWSEAQGMEPERRNDEPVRHRQVELVPAGSVMAFAGEIAPNGWLLCHGQQFSSLTYPELYEVVKEKYAPENIRAFLINRNGAALLEKTFYVPDLRGRVIVGVDDGAGRVTANNTIGANGGTENVILTVDQLAKHRHKIVDANAMNGTLPLSTALGGEGSNLRNVSESQEEGENQPHNNMQPYICLNYIISTGETDKWISSKKDEKINQLEKEIENLKIYQQRRYPKWVVFNGLDGSMFSNSGVSSVERKGNGKYTVSFIEPFSSKNYCFMLTSGNGDTSIGLNTTSAHHPNSQSENNFTFHTFLTNTTSTTNPLVVSAIFYGN